jgi:transposase
MLNIMTVALDLGGAHFCRREVGSLGHEVRFIPPAHDKPFVRRQNNNAVDAEAISEASMRPTMTSLSREEYSPHAPISFR